jgi:hypothetical protein
MKTKKTEIYRAYLRGMNAGLIIGFIINIIIILK